MEREQESTIETRLTSLLNEASTLVTRFKGLTKHLPEDFLGGSDPDLPEELDADQRRLLAEILEQRARIFEEVSDEVARQAQRWIDRVSIGRPGVGGSETMLWRSVEKCLAGSGVWTNRRQFYQFVSARMKYDVQDSLRKRQRQSRLLQARSDASSHETNTALDTFVEAISSQFASIEQLQSTPREAILQRYFNGKTSREIGERLGLNDQQIFQYLKQAHSILRELMTVAEAAKDRSWFVAEQTLTAALSNLKKGLVESQALPLLVQRGLIRLQLNQREAGLHDLVSAAEALNDDCHSQYGRLLDGFALAGEWGQFDKLRHRILHEFTSAGSLEELLEVALAAIRSPLANKEASLAEQLLSRVFSRLDAASRITASEGAAIRAILASMSGSPERVLELVGEHDATTAEVSLEAKEPMWQLGALHHIAQLHVRWAEARCGTQAERSITQSSNRSVPPQAVRQLQWLDQIYYEAQQAVIARG